MAPNLSSICMLLHCTKVFGHGDQNKSLAHGTIHTADLHEEETRCIMSTQAKNSWSNSSEYTSLPLPEKCQKFVSYNYPSSGGYKSSYKQVIIKS